MEEDTNLWNKKTDDITVGDSLKLNALILTAMVMLPVATLTTFAVADKIGNKFRQMKTNRQLKNNPLVIVEEK